MSDKDVSSSDADSGIDTEDVELSVSFRSPIMQLSGLMFLG
jgi:hypothetical protein